MSEMEEMKGKCIYVSLHVSTRRVYLRIEQDLTVESFLLQAYRRFASRKLLPRKMLSDNVFTYVTATEDL